VYGPGQEVIVVQLNQPSSPSSRPAGDGPAAPRAVRAQPVEARLIVPEVDLQMYTAIIGHIPSVQVDRAPAPPPRAAAPGAGALIPMVAPHAERVLRKALNAEQRLKVTSWLRHFSTHARRRIDQARTRLAS
jgi:hypothetical protein